ncbi:MAG: DNA glycosylase [Promethearchaeota archaeon]
MLYELSNNKGNYCANIIKKIQKNLLKWGELNKRKYPWRTTSNSYKIIIAEILLHRTKADQVNKIYLSFINKFPNFKSIVKAGPEIIRSELHSLGLSYRAERIYKMAKCCLETYNGELPINKKKLMKLPGIGNYIASAFLCMKLNQPELVLDTNVIRVIGRVFGIKITDSSRRNKKFINIIKDLINCNDPKNFFLSIIDFAAIICQTKNPKCNECVLKEICTYFKVNNNL